MNLDILSRIPTLRTKLAYLPFIGGVGGPRIGIKPLEGPWLIADEDCEIQLAMKHELLMNGIGSSKHTSDSYPAEREASHLLCEELGISVRHFWRVSCDLQDDLAIMEKDSEGQWRMTAATICFPSSWTLEGMFNQTSHKIHEEVSNDKFNDAVAMSMDGLTEQIVERFNWTLSGDAVLRHPKDNILYDSDYSVENLTKHNAGSKLFIRYERQTLRLMPKSGAVLFTIRVYVDPLRHLKEEHPQHIDDFIKAYKRHKVRGPWCGPMFEYLGRPDQWPTRTS